VGVATSVEDGEGGVSDSVPKTVTDNVVETLFETDCVKSDVTESVLVSGGVFDGVPPVRDVEFDSVIACDFVMTNESVTVSPEVVGDSEAVVLLLSDSDSDRDPVTLPVGLTVEETVGDELGVTEGDGNVGVSVGSSVPDSVMLSLCVSVPENEIVIVSEPVNWCRCDTERVSVKSAVSEVVTVPE